LVEQRTFNPFVAGSTPARPTIYIKDFGALTFKSPPEITSQI